MGKIYDVAGNARDVKKGLLEQAADPGFKSCRNSIVLIWCTGNEKNEKAGLYFLADRGDTSHCNYGDLHGNGCIQRVWIIGFLIPSGIYYFIYSEQEIFD